jgi:hypothetical protein
VRLNHKDRLYLLTASIFVLLSIAPVSCRSEVVSSVPVIDAGITMFEPAAGTFFPGDRVTSTLQFKNTGSEPWTFWVGYSVKNQIGEWYDVAAHPLMLEPGEISLLQDKTWVVPESMYVTGYYTVALAVWDAEPGSVDATKLDYREAEGSFEVLRYIEQFDIFDRELWKKSAHSLGKTDFEPDNVDISDGVARIKIPAGTREGGEFGTRESFTYGTYRARIQVPSLTGLVTGFFLYYGTGGSGNEIDIELYHENDWYIACTAWSDGVMTGTERERLKFDPSEEYHEYRIDFYPGKLDFYVDDRHVQTFTTGLPEEPMRLIVNSWFPDWLRGRPPEKDVYTLVDWIEY